MAGFRITDCVAQRAPGRLIRRIDKLMLGLMEQRLEGAPVTYSQWVTLKLVRDNAVSTAGDLARDLGYTTGATTRLIDGLEEAGFLTRERGRDDRRVVRLTITPRGEAEVDAILPIVLDLWNEMVADFDQAEADQLVNSLAKLLSRVEAKVGETGTGRSSFVEAAE
jgi:DNA-binding MarR family transcriptional regulator